MPRPVIKVADRYYAELGPCEVLCCETFLLCVRRLRSGDRDSFFDPKTQRRGAYGFTPREFKLIGSGKGDLDRAMIESLAYRYFVRCWHETLLAGYRDTAANVATLWDLGLRLGVRAIAKRHFPPFAVQLSKMYRSYVRTL